MFSPFSKIISVNSVAESTKGRGIYMIHEHWLMRDFIWDRLFSFTQTKEFYSSFTYLPIIYGIIVLIFAVCTLLDIGKEKIFSLLQSFK